jgi:hypothetical protein
MKCYDLPSAASAARREPLSNGMELQNEISEQQDRSAWILRIVAAIGAVLAILGLFWAHALSFDELEFFRAADWIREGKVPYRDFWEHHTPLQWYLTAPFTAISAGEGVGPLIVMRWTQVPLWVAILWLAMWIGRQAGNGPWARLAALALVLSSWFFVHKAIEFRVDTMASFFYIAGVALLLRIEQWRWAALAAGASLALATLANLRSAPLVVITVLLIGIVNVPARRWGWNPAMVRVIAGGAAITALYTAYLLLTGSLDEAWQQLIVENAIADRYVKISAFSPFWVRIGVAFGFRVDPGIVAFVLANIDLAGIVIWIVGTVGMVMAIRNERRQPGVLFVLAFLQFANLLFIARMKLVFAYHFETVTVLMIPFVASVFDRALVNRHGRRFRAGIVAIIVVASLLNIWISVPRGQSMSLQAQDSLIREVHARTKPNETVFDAVGWAVHRDPAWRYWFVPLLVHLLDFYEVIPRLTVPYLQTSPPAAVIFNGRMLIFLWQRPAITEYLTRHYLPLSSNLWVPGLSARLDPRSPAKIWRVPADGTYRLYASRALSDHPWFNDPLRMAHWEGPEASVLEVDLTNFPFERGDRLQFVVDGKEVQPRDRVLALRAGSIVSVTLSDRWPLGLLLIRGEERMLFRRPNFIATIDTGEHPAAVHRPAPLHWKKIFGWRDAAEYERKPE